MSELNAPVRPPKPAAAEEEEDPLDAFMSGNAKQLDQQKPAEEEEEDPLDAFMSGNAKQLNQPVVKPTRCEEDEEDDPMMGYLQSRKAKAQKLLQQAGAGRPNLPAGDDSDDEVYAAARALEEQIEYDENDMPVLKDRREIEPLPPVDHASLSYQPFNKDFYREHPEVKTMGAAEVEALRRQLEVRVSGFDCPNPATSWEQLRLGKVLMGAINKHGYLKPTAIQSQSIPILLKGMDVIGLAKTGSGKTAAFVLPMVPHIMDQHELRKGDGPIALILAPTRELAHQIYVEAKKFTKNYQLRVQSVYGGVNKMDQFKGLRRGAEVVVGTPGRVIDMCKMKGGMSLARVTWLVLDEADRMFDLGFEPQVRSIANNVRPDRQTVLFSATMERRIERLVKDIMNDAVRITIGRIGEANKDITQMVHCLENDAGKWGWLAPRVQQLQQAGSMIIFVSTKQGCEQLAVSLNQYAGMRAAALHGDKSQMERDQIVAGFRSGQLCCVVATDVASRGLDIKWIKTVINFDCAKDIDSHVHRIGRTGRAGDKQGTAHTLLTRKEYRIAPQLVRCLEQAEQHVPPELSALAELAGPGGGTKRGPANAKSGLGFGGGGPRNKAQQSAAAWSARLQQHAASSNSKPPPIGQAFSGGSGGGARHPTMRGFKSAGSEGTMYVPPPQPPPQQPPPFGSSSKKRKSRWDS